MRNLIILLCVLPLIVTAQQSAQQILNKAIRYHDPQSNWSSLVTTFNFKETRPSGPDRSTVVSLDNSKGYVRINRNEEEIYEVSGEVANVLKGNREKERGLTLRNYYLYLWGLPMKLLDQSTPEIQLMAGETVEEYNCDVLRVAYEKDTWYFYFDRNSGRMVQYKFFQNEEETKGELITLEEEVIVNDIRIPRKRSWYTLPEMDYLGTDILTTAK